MREWRGGAGQDAAAPSYSMPRDPPAGDPLEQARRTLIRAFMGFGSAGASGQVTGFRANSNRSGTTPAHDWMNVPAHLRSVVQRLRGVVIENRPAMDVMLHHDCDEALHYVDFLLSRQEAKTDGGEWAGFSASQLEKHFAPADAVYDQD